MKTIEKRKIEIDVLPSNDLLNLRGGSNSTGCNCKKSTITCNCFKGASKYKVKKVALSFNY